MATIRKGCQGGMVGASSAISSTFSLLWDAGGCLTELGATVQLNWRPSDPVQGEAGFLGLGEIPARRGNAGVVVRQIPTSAASSNPPFFGRVPPRVFLR